MTIQEISKKFLNEVGYHEKASNKDLYTNKNNGNKNFTKYADIVKNTKLFNGSKQGVEWCAVFIIANFYTLFGEDITHKMLNIPNNSCAAGCRFFYDYMDHIKRPLAGCIIFFGSDKPTHVGYVYKVDDKKVYTVEGNTGNAVKKHSYALDSKKIYGYGLPRYDYIKNTSWDYTFKVKAISGLRVRKGPSTNTDTLRVLKFGTIIKGAIYNSLWIKIEDGYISRKWVDVI